MGEINLPITKTGLAYIDNFDEVFHELYSPDIHLDITIIKPAIERAYYSLVIIGLRAHWMNVPGELEKYKWEKCEWVKDLPADWNIKSNEEKWY